jgi:hypothetical protein
MSVYPSDGELYAGWSTGRWFGLAGVAALAVALLGRQALHGWIAPSLDLTEQMIAVFAEYVGGGLGFIMILAAFSSIGISRQERGDVEVTAEGVARNFSPTKRKFIPRAEIAGFASRPYGGLDLLDDRGRSAVSVPRSIVGYRDCVAELKAMGIMPIERKQSTGALRFSNPMTWKERIQLWSLCGCSSILVARGTLGEHLVGAVLVSALLAWVAIDDRKDPARQWRWVNYAGMASIYGVALRFGSTILTTIRHWW